MGLTSGFAITRAFGSIFFGVQPTDWAIDAIMSSAMLSAGVIAAMLPARRQIQR